MGFNNFRFNILLRVSVLTILLFLMIWSFYFTDLEITPFGFLFLSALSIVELIYYIERCNRKLRNFLEFIHHRDFSSSFIDTKEGETFSELSATYQFLTAEFKQLNAEKEANTKYLELVVEHINVALICLNEEGDITLMNQQAKRLFHRPYLHNLATLEKVSPGLPEKINNINGGEHGMISLSIDNENMELSVHVTEFKLLEQYNKLISFQNIRSELEQHEISSWGRLISVLTHEIMNSVTPIISLSGVLKNKLSSEQTNENNLAQLSNEEISDIHNSINSIESRSKGLQNFVQTYRRLTSIPKPNKSIIPVNSLVENVTTLLRPELDKRSIKLNITGIKEKQIVEVDPEQIEQVLINLIINAMEALSETSNPELELCLEKSERNNISLKVIDNGRGINTEHFEQVFVPFFTTKHDGTGIGLNLSRQFCIQNKVLLSIAASTEKGSVFSLQFSTSP